MNPHSGLPRSARLRAVGVTTTALLGATALIAPMGGAQSAPPASPTAGTYTALAKTDQGPILVGFHVGAPSADGSRPIRVYVCDSFPVAEWFVGTLAPGASTLDLRSRSGKARVRGTLGAGGLAGTADLAGGRTIRFASARAGLGAGIYSVRIRRDPRGRPVLTGRSITGDVLIGVQERELVQIDVLTADGRLVRQRLHDLTRTDARKLRRAGWSPRYRRLKSRADRPGDYVAVVHRISPTSLAILGRDARVTTGQPGTNIIGMNHPFLQTKAFAVPPPPPSG